MKFGQPLGTSAFGAVYSSSALPSDADLILTFAPEDLKWFVKAFPVNSGGTPQIQYWSQGDATLTDPFLERLQRALDFESSIFGARLVVSGISRPDFGTLKVERDVQDDTGLTDLLWDGRALQVWFGHKDWVQTRYLLALSASIKDVRWNESGLTLRLLDAGLGLKEQLQDVLYAGTGGVEGSDNLLDSRKPFCFGKCDNVSPRFVDAAQDIYQVHDRSIEAVRAVYDGGEPITFDSDVGDVTAWTPEEGFYVTDLTNGLIRLGAPPAKGVTADIDGDNEGSVFAQSTAEITERILRQRAGYADADIGQGSFKGLDTSIGGPKGYYAANGSGTLESVINEIMLPVAYFRFNREGLVVVGNLAEGGSSLNLDATNILSLKSVEGFQAVHNVELGYHRSWTVMGDNDFVGDATDAFREFASLEYRVSKAEDPAIDALRGDSVELLVSTLLFNQADADVESARLLAMMKSDKRFWEVETLDSQLKAVPGDSAFLTDANYARTASGLSCIVLRARENSETNNSKFTLWG